VYTVTLSWTQQLIVYSISTPPPALQILNIIGWIDNRMMPTIRCRSPKITMVSSRIRPRRLFLIMKYAFRLDPSGPILWLGKMSLWTAPWTGFRLKTNRCCPHILFENIKKIINFITLITISLDVIPALLFPSYTCTTEKMRLRSLSRSRSVLKN